MLGITVLGFITKLPSPFKILFSALSPTCPPKTMSTPTLMTPSMRASRSRPVAIQTPSPTTSTLALTSAYASTSVGQAAVIARTPPLPRLLMCLPRPDSHPYWPLVLHRWHETPAPPFHSADYT